MNFTLAELSASLGAPASGDAELTGVAVDSRRVKPGDLFVAIRGARVDRHDFASQAAAAGAKALLAEHRPRWQLPEEDRPLEDGADLVGFRRLGVRNLADLRHFGSRLSKSPLPVGGLGMVGIRKSPVAPWREHS